jgi:hypothetical protein
MVKEPAGIICNCMPKEFVQERPGLLGCCVEAEKAQPIARSVAHKMFDPFLFGIGLRAALVIIIFGFARKKLQGSEVCQRTTFPCGRSTS